ncbi:RFX DNA-binding domain [Popillia japonica]|uniref:RFX DNA-binding domain n=1 Tax=Popillia japonica TaxID=7064 RepID=A0AAW1KJX1_POPJA
MSIRESGLYDGRFPAECLRKLSILGTYKYRVNSKNAWTELFEYFRVPGKCVNGSIALKQIYLRYLDRWEKVHYLGEEADRGSDDDEESRHKRWSARALHSVPLTYNYTQHNIAESTREYNHLSTDLYKCSDYDRLALSLLSPLPNEQDFAINVCTLLSNDGKHTLKIEKHPRLIDYLIAHAGVFNHHSLRNVFIESYSKIRGHPLHTFWKDVVYSEEYLDLTDERKYIPEKAPKLTEKGTKAEEPSQPITSEINTGIINVEVLKESPVTKFPEPMIVDSEPVNVDSDSELFASDDVETTTSLNPSYIFKLKPHSSDKDIFCLGRSLGTRDYVGQRVLQVATILRNLTFIEENVPILTKNRTFIRLMLLCVCSRWNQLQNLGMDMLGNVATEFLVKDPQTDCLFKLSFFLIKLVSNGLVSEDRNSCISSLDFLIKLVSNGLVSEDRNSCISSLDALNKLSQNEANEDSLSRCLESFVYARVCSFLTIHDVMLLIYTLECLYSLSSLGERPCNFIVGNHGVVDTLVSLVTVEGKSYGPKACIGMKLVETVPGGNANSSVTCLRRLRPLRHYNRRLKLTVSSSSATSMSTTTSTVTTLQSTPKVSTSQSNTPQRVVQVAPQRLIAITPVSSPAATPTPITSTQTTTPSISPQQLVQQQHAHQQAIQENEQFALAWLRATYEPSCNGRVDHQELYKHYINSCAKIGRRGVIAPLHFPRCVRSVFGGTVGPNPVKPVTSNDPQFYDGIKARAQQLVINMQPVTTPVAQATPKTKAQLSAPPKPRESTVATAISKSDIKSQVMAHPHLSQALLGSAATTAVTQASTSKDAVAGQSNTSLIKSLLATKVNECMTSVSMRTATDCQIVTTQVAARQQQQRLLAQQTTPMQTPDNKSSNSDVSSTTQNSSNKNRREPPQPPPPLAPLSGNLKGKVLRIENEDSDSTGNNSLASSTGLGHVGLGGVSSTEDGDNSLTSFEGLLNGIPSLDNPLNDDSNSKDSLKSSIKKPLMLADLLEKKVEKDPMLLNGVLGKELRLGEKGLDLVENHIEKVLSKENNMNESSIDTSGTNNLDKNNDVSKQTLKRSASEELSEPDAKKIHLSNVNGNADSPAPESVSSSNGDDQPTEKVSTAAAKLFADMAADILEDEDEEELMQEAVGHQQQPPQTVVEDPNVVQIASNNAGVSQMFVDGNQQVLLQPRQIIVSQPQLQPANQMVIPAGTQLKTQGGQTVIVQNSAQQRAPVVLQQANAGQILLSQGLQSIQGQVQLVASSSQPGQYVIQTGGPQSAYVVAQSQTAMVHGQPQTVLVAQTPQQQGTGTKTIIILQQQPTPSATATHHQKVVVTPQGQQVVVTQVQRPILQTSTVSNNPPPTSTVIKSVGSTTTTQVTSVSTSNNTVTVIEKKIEDVKPQPRVKINRDMSTPFVCEWGDCQVDIKFTSANQVYLHVCEEHVPKGSEEIVCQWERCDNMKRKRFSLMTHLNDKHCNTEAMRASLTRRRQMSHAGKVESPVTNTATPHPGYAPDAAFHAIKRHALEFVNPKELQDDNEGPVTKSIRLTASLILRNLVIYSSNCRRYLKHYEPHLANVALSNVESSRTIAQVLYDMNEGASHR